MPDIRVSANGLAALMADLKATLPEDDYHGERVTVRTTNLVGMRRLVVSISRRQHRRLAHLDLQAKYGRYE